VEWSRLLLIAAAQMVGDTETARRLYAEHNLVWPYRSVWHLASELNRTQASQKTFAAMEDAWQQVGMPQFADEHLQSAAAPDGRMHAHPRLEPTPAALPGIAGIDAAALAASLKQPDPPAVIDFGFGAAVPPGATMSTADPLTASDMAALARQEGGAHGVVVMGQGPFDWIGVNAARALAEEGLHVIWFRGGEEAWAKSGLPAEDRRPP
jgi:hypothetical protein